MLEVLESGMLAQGPRVAAFEEAFTRVTGARHAIATSSGTTGLHLALLAHGIGPGGPGRPGHAGISGKTQMVFPHR